MSGHFQISQSADRGSTPTGPILVFGATGQQGGAVAASLRARGRAVRALVRDPRHPRARALEAMGVHLFPGDFSDLVSLRRAMGGAHGVFSVQPNSGQGPASGVSDAQEVRYGKAVADVAVETGVEHLVYSSAAVLVGGPTGVANLDCKIEIETHVRSLDLRTTIIRPSTFMELLLLPEMGLQQDRLTFFTRPQAPSEFIAVSDIGRIAAAVYDAPDRFAGRTLEIAGDELTGEAIAAALARASGRHVAYSRFPDCALTGNPTLAKTAALFDQGRFTGVADREGLELEFGHLLRFEEWLTGPGIPLLKSLLAMPDGHESL